MLQVARLAPDVLGDATDRVAAFLVEQIADDGGARDRTGASDLYYTVFLLEALVALRRDPPVGRVRGYLASFGDGEALDLVHRTCLARCWAALPDGAPPATRVALASRIADHRARDGGFAPEPAAERGTVYHAFLALGALEDLDTVPADAGRIAGAVAAMANADGSYANRADVPGATVPTTAAAVTLLRRLGAPAPAAAVDWLLGCAHPEGGFRATPDTPIPDLLSTATALHALAGAHAPLDALREPSLDFIDTLWTGRAFCGNWTDDEVDCEYAYYALLALGHLSLA